LGQTPFGLSAAWVKRRLGLAPFGSSAVYEFEIADLANWEVARFVISAFSDSYSAMLHFIFDVIPGGKFLPGFIESKKRNLMKNENCKFARSAFSDWSPV